MNFKRTMAKRLIGERRAFYNFKNKENGKKNTPELNPGVFFYFQLLVQQLLISLQ